MSTDGNPTYRAHPELTQYVSSARYENPKEDFKTIGNKLAQLLDPERGYEVADVGCANGELLYYLHRRFPRWKLHGFDHTREFIETARSFPGLEGVVFRRRDLFEIEGTFDVVLSTCFLSLFPDVERPLGKLLELCREGGYLLATGLFNPHDIEVRVQFCDNTNPKTRGVWRTDFNRHSQRRVREVFGPSVQRIEFHECAYDVDIPPDPDRPIRVWSFRDRDGNGILINGACQIANQTLLVMRK